MSNPEIACDALHVLQENLLAVAIEACLFIAPAAEEATSHPDHSLHDAAVVPETLAIVAAMLNSIVAPLRRL